MAPDIVEVQGVVLVVAAGCCRARTGEGGSDNDDTVERGNGATLEVHRGQAAKFKGLS